MFFSSLTYKIKNILYILCFKAHLGDFNTYLHTHSRTFSTPHDNNVSVSEHIDLHHYIKWDEMSIITERNIILFGSLRTRSLSSLVFICVAAVAGGFLRFWSGDLMSEVLCHFLTTNNFSFSVFLSLVCPHPPILHSFPQSLSTFFRFGWQKSKGYGQCRTFFCLLGEGKEVESPLQCMMYEQQIYIHHGHGDCRLYQLSISQYIKESYKKVKS